MPRNKVKILMLIPFLSNSAESHSPHYSSAVNAVKNAAWARSPLFFRRLVFTSLRSLCSAAEELGLPVEEAESLALLAQPQSSALEDLVSSLPGADDQAQRAETSRALAEAVARLPERLQLLVSLHYVDGLAYREIARILDVSEPRVCQLHGEAVGLLRTALQAAA